MSSDEEIPKGLVFVIGVFIGIFTGVIILSVILSIFPHNRFYNQGVIEAQRGKVRAILAPNDDGTNWWKIEAVP